jgi:hypothetical protein
MILMQPFGLPNAGLVLPIPSTTPCYNRRMTRNAASTSGSTTPKTLADGPRLVRVVAFKRFLLLVWAVWLSVVFVSNLADAAKGLGWLPDSWAFASGNLQFIRQTTARYGTPDTVNGVMFAGVIVWEGAAAVLFWRAVCAWRGCGIGRRAVYQAFATSLFLWAGFLVADEVFIAYPLEGTHLRLFVAQLVTLLAVELLPECSG